MGELDAAVRGVVEGRRQHAQRGGVGDVHAQGADESAAEGRLVGHFEGPGAVRVVSVDERQKGALGFHGAGYGDREAVAGEVGAFVIEHGVDVLAAYTAAAAVEEEHRLAGGAGELDHQVVHQLMVDFDEGVQVGHLGVHRQAVHLNRVDVGVGVGGRYRVVGTHRLGQVAVVLRGEVLQAGHGDVGRALDHRLDLVLHGDVQHALVVGLVAVLQAVLVLVHEGLQHAHHRTVGSVAAVEGYAGRIVGGVVAGAVRVVHAAHEQGHGRAAVVVAAVIEGLREGVGHLVGEGDHDMVVAYGRRRRSVLHGDLQRAGAALSAQVGGRVGDRVHAVGDVEESAVGGQLLQGAVRLHRGQHADAVRVGAVVADGDRGHEDAGAAAVPCGVHHHDLVGCGAGHVRALLVGHDDVLRVHDHRVGALVHHHPGTRHLVAAFADGQGLVLIVHGHLAVAAHRQAGDARIARIAGARVRVGAGQRRLGDIVAVGREGHLGQVGLQ